VARDIRVVDVALAAWVAAWLVAAVAVFQSIRDLEDGGRAVVTAGDGLAETSAGLERAAEGIRETAGALGALGELPFVSGDPGRAVGRTADEVERFADRVRVTARDARATGLAAQESARTLSVVLGLAVAFGPTIPALALYLLLRPLVAERLRGR
jgi:hypothetical protein